MDFGGAKGRNRGDGGVSPASGERQAFLCTLGSEWGLRGKHISTVTGTSLLSSSHLHPSFVSMLESISILITIHSSWGWQSLMHQDISDHSWRISFTIEPELTMDKLDSFSCNKYHLNIYLETDCCTLTFYSPLMMLVLSSRELEPECFYKTTCSCFEELGIQFASIMKRMTISSLGPCIRFT